MQVSGEAPGKKSFRPDWVDRSRTTRLVWRIGVSVVGGAVLAAGVVMIPYPGPGWLVVFAGLAILAVEFTWARRLLDYARARYDAWTDWLRRQHLAVRLGVLLLTGVVVVTTIWLLDGFGLLDRWLDLGMPWMGSPLFT